MSKALIAVSIVTFTLVGLLYLQTVYAAFLGCPDKIHVSLVPECVKRKEAK